MVIESSRSRLAHFTIDFECITYDLCRSLGALNKPQLRTDYLIKSISNLEELLSISSQREVRLTFFCTGISADLYPSVIRKIADHGHEIACHGYFHDDINKMSTDELYASLQLAKDKLSQVSDRDVIGFRAPRFSVDKHDFERLEVISRVFRYDSSLHFECAIEFEEWKKNCQVDLVEFPVPCRDVAFSKFKVKLGGSYLKLFPGMFVKYAADTSIENGLMPVFYFHPYDLYFGYDLLASWKELEGVKSRSYWYLRQLQWAGLFNWSQRSKLLSIFHSFDNAGPLGDCVSQMQVINS